jgi:ADP-ribose pyrophosphatase
MDGEEFPLLGSRRLARTGFLTLDRTYRLAPGGAWARREVVGHPGAAAVVPWDGERVHLIRQFRAPAGLTLLEIPAGKLDVAGEDPAAAAARECVEELGLAPGRVTLLQRCFLSPGFSDEIISIFLAEDLEPVTARPQGPEESAAVRVALDLAEVRAALAGPDLRDAKTIVGLQALLLGLGR